MNKLIFYFLILNFFKIIPFDGSYLKKNYKKLIFATLASYGVYNYRNNIFYFFKNKTFEKDLKNKSESDNFLKKDEKNILDNDKEALLYIPKENYYINLNFLKNGNFIRTFKSLNNGEITISQQISFGGADSISFAQIETFLSNCIFNFYFKNEKETVNIV